MLVTAAHDLRDELEPLTDFKLVTACIALEVTGDLADPDTAMRHTLAALAQRCMDLHEEIKIHASHLKSLTRAAAPQLLDAFGIGLDIAAQMLITAGDNTDRVRSEAALAKMCGACPVSAGSGETAVDTASTVVATAKPTPRSTAPVIVRMRWHEPTIAYVTRRTAEGLSKTDIIRCLKRYLVRDDLPAAPRHQRRTRTRSTSFSRVDRLDDL